MNTQNLTSRPGRSALRLSVATIVVAFSAVLLPTEAMAATDSVTITSPTDGEVLTASGTEGDPTLADSPVVVTFVADPSPATCSLDDQAPFACTSPVSFDHVVAGDHHVTVTAGTATQTVSFTVTTILLGPPPVAPIVIDDDGLMRPVGVTARWRIGAHRTWVRLLKLRHMPGHVRVHVTCKGRGCPSPHRFTRRAYQRLDLTRYFRGHGLRPGARIVLRVTKCGDSIGTFRYTMRSGARPRLAVS